MSHKINIYPLPATSSNKKRETNLEDGELELNLELEFEFDTFISRNPRFFEELEKLGVKFEKEIRFCG